MEPCEKIYHPQDPRKVRLTIAVNLVFFAAYCLAVLAGLVAVVLGISS